MFAKQDYKKCEFLLEYPGVLRKASDVREDEDTTFIFFFKHGNDNMWYVMIGDRVKIETAVLFKHCSKPHHVICL